MGEDFSGSCAVASRNTLLHNGATNATWSGHFYPEAVPPCRSRAPGAEFGGSLATANFRELLFYEYFIDGTSANRPSTKFRANLIINSPASVRNKAGRMNGLIERPSPDPYAVFAPRTAAFPAIVIPPIRRKYFGEVYSRPTVPHSLARRLPASCQ